MPTLEPFMITLTTKGQDLWQCLDHYDDDLKVPRGEAISTIQASNLLEPGDVVYFERDGPIYHFSIAIPKKYGQQPLIHDPGNKTDRTPGVEFTTLERQLIGCSNWSIVKENADQWSARRRWATVRLAYNALGKKGYHLLKENCESFAQYCNTGHRGVPSVQVRAVSDMWLIWFTCIFLIGFLINWNTQVTWMTTFLAMIAIVLAFCFMEVIYSILGWRAPGTQKRLLRVTIRIDHFSNCLLFSSYYLIASFLIIWKTQTPWTSTLHLSMLVLLPTYWLMERYLLPMKRKYEANLADREAKRRTMDLVEANFKILEKQTYDLTAEDVRSLERYQCSLIMILDPQEDDEKKAILGEVQAHLLDYIVFSYGMKDLKSRVNLSIRGLKYLIAYTSDLRNGFITNGYYELLYEWLRDMIGAVRSYGAEGGSATFRDVVTLLTALVELWLLLSVEEDELEVDRLQSEVIQDMRAMLNEYVMN